MKRVKKSTPLVWAKSSGAGKKAEYRRAVVSDEAGKEKHAVGVGQILRSKPQIGHEVASVVQGHDGHDQSTQNIRSEEPRSLHGDGRALRLKAGCDRRTDGRYHAPRLTMRVGFLLMLA